MNKKILFLVLSTLTTNSFADAVYVTNAGEISGPIVGSFQTYFGPGGVYTQLDAQGKNALNATLQSIQGTQQLQIAQQEQHKLIEDVRTRRSLGMAEIARRDNLARPTIEQCIERSKAAAKFTAGSGARRGGYTGKELSPTAPGKTLASLKSEISVKANPLKQLKLTGTCDPYFGNVANCTSSAEDTKYAKADTLSTGITSNMDASVRKSDSQSDFSNYSIQDEKGYAAGEKYINDSTIYDAPIALSTKEDWEKNPAYTGMYKTMTAKIMAAQVSLRNILNFTNATKPLPTEYKSLWEKNSKDYNTIFPDLTKPEKPSMFEIINFAVYKDFILPDSESDTNKDIAKKLALSNFIAWRQYQSQQDNNIMLAHLLMQSVTPIDKSQLKNEYQKAMSSTQ